MPPKDNSDNNLKSDEIKGFEEFVKDLDLNLKEKLSKQSKDFNFDSLTFFKNDETRLNKIKDLLIHKIPLAIKFDQTDTILQRQQDELIQIKSEIFQYSEDENSNFKRSLSEIFDQYFSDI